MDSCMDCGALRPVYDLGTRVLCVDCIKHNGLALADGLEAKLRTLIEDLGEEVAA